jgi:hypothetical protein
LRIISGHGAESPWAAGRLDLYFFFSGLSCKEDQGRAARLDLNQAGNIGASLSFQLRALARILGRAARADHAGSRGKLELDIFELEERLLQ